MEKMTLDDLDKKAINFYTQTTGGDWQKVQQKYSNMDKAAPVTQQLDRIKQSCLDVANYIQDESSKGIQDSKQGEL